MALEIWAYLRRWVRVVDVMLIVVVVLDVESIPDSSSSCRVYRYF